MESSRIVRVARCVWREVGARRPPSYGYFPLEHDVRVSLRVSYSYGLEASYRLTLEPVPGAEAPFRSVEARWVQAGEGRVETAAQDVPIFPEAGWTECTTSEFLRIADHVARGRADDAAIERVRSGAKLCWSKGRSEATAPEVVKLALPSFISSLLAYLPAGITIGAAVPRALEILASLHEDAPVEAGDRALEFDRAAADDFDVTERADGSAGNANFARS